MPNTPRVPDHPVDPIFPSRWSPRAMSGAPLTRDQLLSLFEAARWAPSSYNNQPWRFVYAERDTPAWHRFVDLLDDFNRQWAPSAAVLIVVLSRRTFDDGKPSPTHSFDTGAAWENLALEATRRGLVTHGMEGFDYARARDLVDAPDGYAVEAMLAVGVPADPSTLPDSLQEHEEPPGRKPVGAIAFEGRFPVAPQRVSEVPS